MTDSTGFSAVLSLVYGIARCTLLPPRLARLVFLFVAARAPRRRGACWCGQSSCCSRSTCCCPSRCF
ncbi:protein of unknown function [Paraburkholderia kururiensis]